MLPFWISGLLFYFREAKYRMLGWMYLIPVIIFFLMQGRGYYPAPTYVMLIAAGAVVFERRLETSRSKKCTSPINLELDISYRRFVRRRSIDAAPRAHQFNYVEYFYLCPRQLPRTTRLA